MVADAGGHRVGAGNIQINVTIQQDPLQVLKGSAIPVHLGGEKLITRHC